jgi:Beta-propeller repeat
MKTFFSQQLSLCGAALAVAILGDSQSQAQSWTNRYNGPGSDFDHATAVAVDGVGNVVVTGQSSGIGSGSDYATLAYSIAGAPLWTNRYNGPGNSFDYPSGVAVDGSGNVFVTGYCATTNGLADNYDYATIKYSGAGVPLWTNRYNGPGNGDDHARAVAVDSLGNVVVTGDSLGSGSGADYATIKYSGAGVPLWTNRYNGPGNGDDYAYAVAVDASGNVFVTGYSLGYGSGDDYATVAYSSAGAPLWTNRYDGPAHLYDRATAIVVDGSSNVVVTGYSTGSTSSYDYVTIKYSGAGAPLWTNLYNGPANSADYAAAVAVDGSGNVFVTGDSLGSGSIADYATVAYSSAGAPLWTNRYNSPVRNDAYPFAVAVDGSGNVFVTGEAPGSGGYGDYVTIKYSGAGVPLWTNRYNGPANDSDYAVAMAVDASGSVVVTGSSYATGANYDYVTIRYANSAAPVAPVFTSIAPNLPGTQVLLTYTSDPGASFNLLSSTNLATWQTNTTVNAIGVTNSVSVNITQPYEFYRLQRLP